MKKLLKESEIRKMMKFANIGALSDSFVKKINEAGYYDEEEVEEMDYGLEGHDHGMMEQEDDEPDDLAMDAPGGDMDAPGDDMDAPGGAEDDVLQAVQTVIKAIKAGLEEMGMEAAAAKIDVELEDEPDAMDDPMGDEPDAMDDAPEPPPEGEDDDAASPPVMEDELDEGAYGEGDDDLEEAVHAKEGEEDLEEAMDEEEDEAMVNEIVRRVAARLMKR